MKYITEYSKITFLDDNGNEVGNITYPETEDGVFTIDHTFVDLSMQGKGIAAKLVQLAINDINMRGGETKATCSYAQSYIKKHGLRPVVICHMVTSIDGKVTGDFLYSEKGLQVSESYYEINRMLKGDAFACGRVTMESSFTNGFKPDLSSFADAVLPCEDYIAMKHSYYAVSFDRLANVGWTDNMIHDEDEGYDNCHIIEVVTENAPASMLAYYRSIGVSYIFAGKDDIDLKLALNKLYSIFGIKKLLLEGGSIINGSFEREGLIDSLSLVVAPMIGNKDDKPLFMNSDMCEFRHIGTNPMEDGSIWIRYAK